MNDRKKNLGPFKEPTRKWRTSDPQAVLEGPEYQMDTHIDALPSSKEDDILWAPKLRIHGGLKKRIVRWCSYEVQQK